MLHSGQVSTGPVVQRFEEAFAEYIGKRFAVAVNGGTSGLHLCMIAASVKEGDFVITSPSSFIASANCVLYQGAVPVFVDVDPITGNIDSDRAAQAAADLAQGGKAAADWLPRRCQAPAGGKLRAILPVHTLGWPAEIEPLHDACKRWGIALIEDCCEALGTQCAAGRAGFLGDASVFGFYANKPITTGEGGMVVTSREDWDFLFRSLRNQGRDVADGRLRHQRVGFNYRMDAMSAALGLAQMGRIGHLLQKREQVARWYDELLSAVDWIERPRMNGPRRHRSWFAYAVRIVPPLTRDAVAEGLARRNIPSRVYFPPIHLQKPYKDCFDYREGDFPHAESIGATTLALPFSGIMSEEQVEKVCLALRQIGQSCC